MWKIAPLFVERAATIQQLNDALIDQKTEHFESIKMAFKSVIQDSKNNQLILVCGSFHTLEAVWEYLEECP